MKLGADSEKVLRKVIHLSKIGRAIKRIGSDLITKHEPHEMKIQYLEEILSILDSFEICLHNIENKLINPNFQNNDLEFKDEKKLLTQLLNMLEDSIMSNNFENQNEKRYLENVEDYKSKMNELLSIIDSTP